MIHDMYYIIQLATNLSTHIVGYTSGFIKRRSLHRTDAFADDAAGSSVALAPSPLLPATPPLLTVSGAYQYLL